MSKYTVLITGSSGLIGRALCHSLGNMGCNVIGFDKEDQTHTPPNTDCIFVDMTSDESVQNGFHIVEERYGNRLYCVIDLAAHYSFSGEPSPLYDTLTIGGTERLFRDLIRFSVGQLIFSSSILVHAPGKPGQRINEESPILATWAYPASKVKAERIIQDQHGVVPTVILRIAAVYTDLCQSALLAHQIQRIYENRITSHVYPGDLASGQSFVHLDDVVDAFLSAMHKRDELPAYSAFLIGEPDTLSYAELQREIGLLLYGTSWDTAYVPKTIARAGAWLKDNMPLGQESFIKPWMIDRADDHYALATTLAETLLDWTPQHSLRLTLPAIIAALKLDTAHWYRLNKLAMPSKLEHLEPGEQFKKSA